MPARLRRVWLAAAAAAGVALRAGRRALPAVQALLALGLVAYGCWLAWAPLGFIAPGVVLLADRVADQARTGRGEPS